MSVFHHIAALILCVVLIGSVESTKQWVYRLDDVQDYWQSATQQSIIQWCMDNNVAISIGVIGGVFFGADSALVNQVKSCLQLGDAACEVFNHGIDAQERLGDGYMTVEEIESYIQQAHTSISVVLGDYKPQTFVPHQNSWSEDVVTALGNLNYGVISASIQEGMAFDLSTIPLRMPQQTETADLVGDTWIQTPAADILSDCQNSGDEVCIVMSHPQEFEQGIVTLDDMAELKALFDNDGWTSVTFAEAAAPYLPEPSPSPSSSTNPPPPEGPKQWVYRLDDVQDYWQSETQQAIIQWCMDNGVAISIGVIGGQYIFGHDAGIVNKVKSCLQLGGSACEVYNHGMDAYTRLGDGSMTVDQLESWLLEAHGYISSALDGYDPRAFVPHENSWSEDLCTALQNIDYNVISASEDEGMYFDVTTIPLRMPQQTETAVYAGGAWNSVAPADILADCQASGNNVCVVMSHPQEFEQGTVTLQDLQDLKTLFEDDGWASVTFSDAAAAYLSDSSYSTSSPSPTESSSSTTTPTIEASGVTTQASSTLATSITFSPTEFAPNGDPCCPPGFENEMLPFNGCTQFYSCLDGIPNDPTGCPSGLRFNAATLTCDWAYNVESCEELCAAPNSATPTSLTAASSSTFNPTSSATDSLSASSTESPTESSASPTNSPTSSPTNSPTVSPTASQTASPSNSPTDSASWDGNPCCPDGYSGFLPFNGCTQYYQCANGVPTTTMSCSSGLLFDTACNCCNWSYAVLSCEEPCAPN